MWQIISKILISIYYRHPIYLCTILETASTKIFWSWKEYRISSYSYNSLWNRNWCELYILFLRLIRWVIKLIQDPPLVRRESFPREVGKVQKLKRLKVLPMESLLIGLVAFVCLCFSSSCTFHLLFLALHRSFSTYITPPAPTLYVYIHKRFIFMMVSKPRGLWSNLVNRSNGRTEPISSNFDHNVWPIS